MAQRRDEERHLDRWTYERSLLRPDWGRTHPSDPNWEDGHYHGMRGSGGRWQGSYGRHRQDRHEDLGGFGGFQGRYTHPAGGFGPDGLLSYQDRRSSRREPPRALTPAQALHPRDERWEGGGVYGTTRYLRQYNSRSPELRYDREFRGGPARAERAREPNPRAAEEPTHEREYGGYNPAGWAPGTWQGPGTRAWNPNRR